MKVTLESTTKIVTLLPDGIGAAPGVPARLWEGTTESGIKVHAFITRIAIDKTDAAAAAQFERELVEQRPPSPVIDMTYPARMIL